MNIKEFTKSVISVYQEKGGLVTPDITLEIFKMIENDKSLLEEYYAFSKCYKEINPTIGKTIREHFDLRNDKVSTAVGQCVLIKAYMRFHKK